MECPACGHDSQQRLKTPIRSAAIDERHICCTQCGLAMDSEEKLTAVYVLNPLTLKRERIPVSKLTPELRQYLIGRGPYPGQTAYLE